MRIIYDCNCRFDMDMFLDPTNHLIDNVIDKDKVLLCNKHMNVLCNDYVKRLKKTIISKSAVENSPTTDTYREKIKIVKLYQKDYSRRLKIFEEIEQNRDVHV